MLITATLPPSSGLVVAGVSAGSKRVIVSLAQALCKYLACRNHRATCGRSHVPGDSGSVR
jgi:hypothetical protein